MTTTTNIPPTGGGNNILNSEQQNSSSSSSSQPPPLLIPSFAAWFSLEAVHEIERSAFPELLTSPPELGVAYREYRNYMISTYRARPWEYLSLTACRRNLSGDVAFLAKIFSFLEHWGLINYAQSTELQIPPRNNPGEGFAWRSLNKDHRLAQNLSLPELAAAGGLELECRGCNKPMNPGFPFYALFDRSNVPDGSAVRCQSCFCNGNLLVDKSAADYVRVDPRQYQSSNWTDANTLKLVDFISNNNNNANVDWDAVSEYMQKSKEECIWQVLRLPFPSSLLEAQSPEEAAAQQSAPDLPTLPFSFVRNPTMALLTFLASQVHPKVAASAAQGTLQNIKEEDDITCPTTNAYLASAALALASARAKQLAEEEQRKICQLHDNLVSLQMRKVQQKMTQLEALAKGIEDEKKAVEAQRVAVFYERYKLFQKLKQEI